jgi:hypothetical protein
MKFIKYITAGVWLFALLLPLATPLLLQLKQHYVQWQMMEALEENELITFTVDAEAVQWIKKGKECIINGKMFDVKESVYHHNNFILTGLFDEKEKEIKLQLQAFTKEEKKKHHTADVIKLLLQTAAIHNPTLFNFKPQLSFSGRSLFKDVCYSSPFHSITTPPPRLS